MFAGTPYGGLWRSNDKGVNWVNVPLLDANGQQLEVNSVNDIVLTKQGSNVTLYITTGSSSKYSATTPWVPSCGIYKSNNLGATFKPVGTFNTQFGGYTFSKQKIATKIAIHPQDTLQMFVACSDGLLKTVNAGATWTRVLLDGDENEPSFDGNTDPLAYNSPLTPGIWSVAYSPTNINTIYASGRNVYKSISSGDVGTFSIITNIDYENRVVNLGGINVQRNMNIEVTQSGSSDLVYCTSFIRNAGNKAGYAAYRSSTGGQAPWTFLADGNQFTNLCADDRLKIDSRPTAISEVIVGIVRLRRSTNSGLTWSELGNGQYHDDIHAVAYNPLGTEVFLGTDGGIWRYNPNTNVLTESNFGLSVSTVLDMATSSKYKGHLSSGKQDTNYDFFNGTSWTQDGARGDGYPPTWFDRTEQEFVFLKRYNTEIWKRDMLTGTYTFINKGNCFPDDSLSIEQIYQNPLPNFSDRFYTSASNRIHLSNSTNHLTDLRLLSSVVQTPPVYGYAGIRKFLINKQENALYATQRNGGFWSYSHISKFNLSNFTDPVVGECFTNDNCINLCTEEIDYINHSTNSCLGFYTASSVAFDANSTTNKMWVAIDYDDKFITHPKYTNNGCQAAHSGYRYKIRKRVNGVWSNDDVGLPNYPIRHLVYVDGSNDAMFCATANGRIFYKNANLTQWQEVNPNLPRSPISKLEINYCTKRLYVATFGRGIYYVDLNSIPAHTNQALEITTDQTWTSNYYDIGSNIIVKSGKTLTINGTNNGTIVNMSKDSKIVVERNARLIVIDATLTNSCGELWAGIEVLGDNTKAQIDIDFLQSPSYTGDQGACVFSGSTLEFMNYGVVMGKHIYPGNNSFNGGQIVTNSSFFNNNVKSIAFSSYTTPTDPGNPVGVYKSKLKDTDFNNTSVSLFKHVIVSGVRGLSIEGCTFKNSVSFTQQPYSNRGFGVHVLGGEVIALTNTQSGRQNKFDSLTYGIKIDVGGFSSGGNTIGSKVNNAIFTNNKYGMYMANGTFAKITANTFNVPGLDDCAPIVGGVPSGDCKSYGLYLLGSVGYKVQDNVFNATGGPLTQRKTYGILVNNAAANNESIRRNTFNLFRYAMTAVGVNSNISGSSGLQFLCNTLNQNRASDLWVTEDATTTGSIRSDQGANCNGISQNAANNVFNQGNASTPSLQLARNQNTLTYTYWAQNNTSTYWPPRAQSNYVISRQPCTSPLNVVFSFACPSQLDPTDYQPLLINQWNGQMAAMRGSIDGGNTVALKNELAEATAFDIAAVYEELKQKEAVSDEVLQEAIENPYAEYGLEELKALIIKNSGLEDTHLDALIAAQLPFTSSDVNDMEAAQNKLSPEDIIKAQLADQESLINEYTMAWCEKYMESGEVDSALLMLKLYETPSTLAQLTSLSLRKGRYLDAAEAAQKLNDQDMVDFINMVTDVKSQNKEWSDIDSTTANLLWTIYQKGGRAAIYAAGVLSEVADTNLLPYLPDEDFFVGKKEEEAENKWRLIKTVNNGAFTVSPNPASQSLQLSFSTKEANRLSITILDANSAVVYTTTMTNAKAVVNVSNWKTGLYLIKATDDLWQNYFKKFDVSH